MTKSKSIIRFTLVSAIIVANLTELTAAVETWHLEKGADWKAISEQDQDKYLMAVAQIKKLVYQGQTDELKQAIEQFKKDFPRVATADLDAFLKAEMLFSSGKLTKAAKSYNKLMAEYPDSELYQAALERNFTIATAFLAGQKIRVLKIFKMRGYAEGQKMMEKIIDRAGDAPIGKKAALAIVQSLEKRKKHEQAYQQWSKISSKWSTGEVAKDALLGMARCKHAAYRGPKYDASSLISAKSYYENFKSRYPDQAQEIDVDGKLEQITEQLAYKELNIAQYYDRTGNKQSANIYYQMVSDGWPNSNAARAIKKR
ncbi:MAG: outer membrane protein assembly factor BamD [Planctomycetota bacterium]|jgi:outer membrane protein assembly factor BamD (BamD/ComL family)